MEERKRSFNEITMLMIEWKSKYDKHERIRRLYGN